MRESSSLRKSISAHQSELTRQDSTYGNLVQVKAQNQAQNRDLAYVKRDSTNDRIAKETSQKQKRAKSSSLRL